jgi:hypothetical protein
MELFMLLLFKQLVLPFIYISLLSAGVIGVVRFDYFVLQNNLNEVSLTELFQQLFLFICVVVFSREAISNRDSRSFFVLISAFFGCMLLRELDYYFDLITHGFWLYPTIILAISAIFYSINHRENFFESVNTFCKTHAYFNILIGLVIILVFSRLFGSGTLWKDVMGENYLHVYKTILQECLELFGYIFLFIGSIYQLKASKKTYN